MKEAMGATWIFTICLTFIILMTAYLAISVNYAKAFKIKSYIVGVIEEQEGYNDSLGQEIETYLTAQGYGTRGTCPNLTNYTQKACLQQDGYGNCGICIYQSRVSTNNDDINATRQYYRVVAFFKFDLPIVNFLTTFKVGGETAYVYDTSSTGGTGNTVYTTSKVKTTTKKSSTGTTTKKSSTGTTTKVIPTLRDYIIARAGSASIAYYDCVTFSNICEKTSEGHLTMWPCQDYISAYGTMSKTECEAEVRRIYSSLPETVPKNKK